jgi:hypothetical protein
MAGIEFDSFKLSELNTFLLYDILSKIKEETINKDIDYCEIEYDYTEIENKFGIDLFQSSLLDLYFVSIFKEDNNSSRYERLFTKIGIVKNKPLNEYFMLVGVSNIHYLKENYFAIKKK